MSENNNKFQSRLDAISKAEVVLHINGYWHEIQIESSDNRLTSGALTYTQYDNVFDETKSSYSFVGVSDDGAIVNGYIHDGSSKIGRGYGGDSFELTMNNGSHKVISGPWSGRPSVHTANSGIEYAEVRVGYELVGFSREFIEAIIDRFNLNARLELTCQDMEIELQVINNNKGGK
jgi:hypothetical protein